MRKVIFIALLIVCALANGQGIKISALPSATSLTGNEVLPIVQNSVTKKTTVQSIANLGSGGGSIDTNSFWNINGNSGTNPATNFVGTTDAKDLVLKSNAIEGFRMDTFGQIGLNGVARGVPLTINVANGNDALHFYDTDNSGLFANINTSTNPFTAIIPGAFTFTASFGASDIFRQKNTLEYNYYFPDTTGTLPIIVCGGYANQQGVIDTLRSVIIVDGTQGAGKVLTSGANGLASWDTTSFTTLDSVSIYAITPTNGTTYFCSDCSGDAITGRIVSFFGGLWRRLKFD